jgi:putative hemolysin
MSVVTNSVVVHEKDVLFSAYVASSETEVLECQKLRYRVFAEEMGAFIKTKRDGVDEDYFDNFCKHLYVRNNDTNEIVATTRVLTSQQARITGKYYSESEFYMKNILALKGNFLEIGRTCVKHEHRTGAAINALWQRVARVLAESNADYMFGCYSITMNDSSHYLNSIMDFVKENHFAPLELRVAPKHPLALRRSGNILDVVLPSLLKRYLNMGAYVCGEPCYDKDFNTADLLILVDKTKISKNYARRFFNIKNK